MSNLSDLLPAGGGAKVITATADGNLATGQTVALQSNGTVKGVAADANSSSLGSAAIFAATGTGGTTDNCVAYDSVNNKILVAYKETNTGKGKAVVGTISGTSITFGTAAEFAANIQGDGGRRIGMCFNATEGKFVIVFRDNTINNYGRAVTATISGTSVSFGSSAVWSGTSVTNFQACSFDSTSNRVIIVYSNDSDGGDGYAVVAKITGTSLSFGTPVEFESGYTYYPVAVYDSNADKTVFVYRDGNNSNYGTACVASVSDMTISYGSPVVFESAQTEHQSAAYDSANYKIVIGYSDQGNSGYGTGIVGTVSGTSISFGSAAVFESASTGSVQMQAAYNVAAGKTVIGYGDSGNSNYGTYVEATVSGTSLTFSTPAVFNSSTIDNTGAVAAYDSSNKAVVFTFQDEGNSNAGEAVAYISGYSNSGDFVGITNQAINDTASGEVVVEGGVITNGSLLPSEASSTFGSEVVFNAGATRRESAVYDTGNDKVVISFQDEADSNKGKSIVGTVSGTSISYGSEVEFNGGDTQYIRSGYDPDQGKVVIAYRDQGNSNYGTAIVGTVSGTSISFGSEVVFESAETITFEVVYDTSNDKIVIFYLDEDNSNYGTAIVGTVSGTSISFGTPVVFESTTTNPQAAVFDSTNNKILVAYRALSVSKLIVGTVSGTSISFGSTTTYASSQTYNQSLAHDTSSGKNVLTYRDEGNSAYGTAVVATISGTSVSVGTAVVFNAATTQATSALYDPTTNATFVFYKDGGNSDYGTAKGGIVSGTDITFGSASVWNTGNPGSVLASVKDPDQNKVVVVYADYGNSQYGTAVVGTLSTGVPNFTIGSTYYVQDDGTLSTTSSSVTAGKAIANTTLLLKG